MPTPTTIRPEVLVLASRYDLSWRLRGIGTAEVWTCILPTQQRGPPLVLAVPRPMSEAVVLPHERHSRRGRGGSTRRRVLFDGQLFSGRASQAGRRPEEQFHRAQWAAFQRNLMVFDTARWVNHPTRTYEAEHKMVQLRTAHDVGFDIPVTTCLNSERFLGNQSRRFSRRDQGSGHCPGQDRHNRGLRLHESRVPRRTRRGRAEGSSARGPTSSDGQARSAG